MNLQTAARPLNTLALCIVVLTAFAYAFVPIEMSQDEWWHLKTGKWIWENGMRVPRNDVFALASENMRWDNHEWLSQVGMYLAWRFGEISNFGPMRAVITTKTLVWLAALIVAGVLGWRRSRNLGAVLLVIALAATVGRRTLQPRPPVLSYLLIAIFQYILIAWKAGAIKPKWLIALPALMLLWANLHGGFILGGIMIALFFIGELLEAAWSRFAKKNIEAARASMRRAGTLFGIGALTGATSLCTPFGWRLYLLPLRVMSDPELVARIAELQSPFTLWPLWILWPYLALVILFLAGLLLVRRGIWAGEALWVAFLFQQSSQHLRHMPLFAIAAIAPCSLLLARMLERVRTGRQLKYVCSVLAVAISIYFLTSRLERPQSFLDRSIALFKGRAYRTEDYPVRLADFLEDADIRGRMFNDSRYAGYLIWRLSPERMKVFTDMRYDIFGGEFLPDEYAVRQGQIQILHPDGRTEVRKWDEVLDKWSADIVILDKLEGRYDDFARQRPMWVLPQLENSPDWTLIYADPVPDRGLVVFMRTNKKNEGMIGRAKSLAPEGNYQRPGRETWGR